MSDLQIFLILAGIVLTTVAAGYVCLLPETQTHATASASAVQDVSVIVKGGYSPDLVVVQQGRPVRFKFTRQESAICSERVLFPDFNKDISLPENEPTVVEFTPAEPGAYDFHCQMGMLQGTLIVK